MTPRTWALKVVGRQTFHDKRLGPVVNFPRAIKLVQAEHARSVRIVNRAVNGHMRRDDRMSTTDWIYGYQQACADILAVLKRGR